MTSEPQTLEGRLRILIDQYRKAREKNRLLSDEVVHQAKQIQQLKELCETLRQQVDELGRDRMTLKRMKSERKTIRKNLDTAVKRLANLEQELIP